MKTEILKFPSLLRILAIIQFVTILAIALKTNYSKTDIYIMSAISLFVLFILIFAKLIIKIESEVIKYKCFPFMFTFKSINKSDIKNAYIGNSSDFSNVIGYGLRFSKKYGRGYIFGSDKAIFIELNNGKKIVLSVEKPEDFSIFLR